MREVGLCISLCFLLLSSCACFTFCLFLSTSSPVLVSSLGDPYLPFNLGQSPVTFYLVAQPGHRENSETMYSGELQINPVYSMRWVCVAISLNCFIKIRSSWLGHASSELDCIELFQRTRLGFQHPHGTSQPPVTPVPRI